MRRIDCMAFAIAMTLAPLARAEELPPGTVLDGTNIDRHAEATFEGHRIAELVPDRFQWAMREQGLTMRLASSTPLPVDSRYEAASAANAGQAFDPNANTLAGWRAGRPFPRIADDDPDAARKVVWNYFVSQQRGDGWHWPLFAYVMVDGRRGLDRVQTWSFKRIAMKGRLADPAAAVLEPGNVLHRTMAIAQSPSDLRGTGIFTIAYDDGRMSDQWVYVPDQRRSRRVSGSNWMNPIANTDVLSDDFAVWDAHPDWYARVELVGRRWVLAVPNGQGTTWDPGAGSDPAALFPKLDLATAPYWNSKEDWVPREVFVIKATPPPEHPYGHKIVYFDTGRSLAYLMEAYDKSGGLQKLGIHTYTAWPLEDRPGDRILFTYWAAYYDLQSMHATMVYAGPDAKFNVPMTPEDVTLQVMEQQSR